MRLDPLISRRFEELTTKAIQVSKTKLPGGFEGSHDSVSSALFKEWATNALSLLDRSFGRESVHFVRLLKHCDRKTIPHGKLDKMNADLCKAGMYNMAKQKQITAWAEIGNKAAHGEWNQYTSNDAQAMLDGVESLVADVL